MPARAGFATGMYEIRDAEGSRRGPLYSSYDVAAWYRQGDAEAEGIWYVTRADADRELRQRERHVYEDDVSTGLAGCGQREPGEKF